MICNNSYQRKIYIIVSTVYKNLIALYYSLHGI